MNENLQRQRIEKLHYHEDFSQRFIMFYHRLFSNYPQVTEYASHIIIIILFPLKF